MNSPETDRYVGLCETDDINEVRDIIGGAIQALAGAKSICFWYDNWNPAAVIGDNYQFSFNTAIEYWIGLVYNEFGWYRDKEQMVKVSRIAQYVFSDVFDFYTKGKEFEGQISQPRTEENYHLNVGASEVAIAKLSQILMELYEKEPNLGIVRILGK